MVATHKKYLHKNTSPRLIYNNTMHMLYTDLVVHL